MKGDTLHLRRAVMQLVDWTGDLPVVRHLHRTLWASGQREGAPWDPAHFQWRTEQAGRFVFADHREAAVLAPRLLEVEAKRVQGQGLCWERLAVYTFVERCQGVFYAAPEATAVVFGRDGLVQQAIETEGRAVRSPAVVYAETARRLGEREEVQR